MDLSETNEIDQDNLPSFSAAKTTIARWYAIQVASSCEKKVKATLEQRAVTLGVSNRIIEIEIPQTPAVKLKKDGPVIGTVTNLTTAGNDLLEVQLLVGRKVLIPFVHTIVPIVNINEGWLMITPPPGLLEL